MLRQIDPVRPARGLLTRRLRDDAVVEEADTSGLVPVVTRAPPPTPAPPLGGAIDGYLLAQDARMRGLRAGAQALVEARSVYLKTEWSGQSDRRRRQGGFTDSEA